MMSVCLDGLEAEREVALVKKVAAVGGDAAAAVAVWEAFVAHMAGLDLAGNKAESAEIAETGRELQMKHLGNSAFELLVLAGSGAAVSEKLVAAPAAAFLPCWRNQRQAVAFLRKKQHLSESRRLQNLFENQHLESLHLSRRIRLPSRLLALIPPSFLSFYHPWKFSWTSIPWIPSLALTLPGSHRLLDLLE